MLDNRKGACGFGGAPSGKRAVKTPLYFAIYWNECTDGEV